ncbi:mercuric reductase [Chitinophaga vietnamensis]|uniref:mercuric reductase n=1 Tax=Chitinophaga vietnamensis TaxID=2593957 RepID=UPI001177B5B2|nr:mercuric reductase [Chitinophaga vietnamensis]
MEKFDAIIIGSGQAGNPLARKLAAKGYKTAVIEQRLLGGTCINDGCTPTKAMIACARVAHTVANSISWGVRITGHHDIDLPFIVARKNEIVQRFRYGVQKGLEAQPGLNIIYGSAAFTSPKTLLVEAAGGNVRTLSAEKIFINTGTTPLIPDIPGLSTLPYYTSTTLLDETIVPPELLVLGGSYVGLELGQLFQRLGSNVSIIESSPQLMSHEDEDVAAVIRNILEDEGMKIYTSSKADKITRTAAGLSLDIITGTGRRTLTCTHILVATGRKPQTATLQLSKANVTTDEHGFIQVDDKLETSAPGIFALGDVKGGPAFTHIAYHDHLIVYRNLFEQGNMTVKTRQVPYCMFTDPQLGRIGLSEKEAVRQGYPIQVAHLGMDKVARAIETGHTSGFLKAVVHAATGKILGAAVVGEEGGELMSLIQMAMAAGITASQLRDMVFAHPLYAESLNNLFMTLDK